MRLFLLPFFAVAEGVWFLLFCVVTVFSVKAAARMARDARVFPSWEWYIGGRF